MESLDIYDSALLKPKSKALLQSEVAISKLMDYFFLMQDSDDLLAKAGIERYRLRSLLLDDEVLQCVETREDAIQATRWRIEPNNTRAGRWLSAALEDHVDGMLRGFMEAIWYGYSVQEIVYQQIGKYIGINRCSVKPMQWFTLKTDGEVWFNGEDGKSIRCDPIKFMVARHRSRYENQMGEALLSRLWFPVTWRREGWQMWLHFLETFGDPIIIGQVPNYKEFITAMQKQGVRSAVAWQSVSSEDRVTTINASTPGEFASLEGAITKRIQKLILGQTMTSDVGQSGSYAVAAVHNQVRKEKVASDIRFETRLMQGVVDRLCALNGFERHRFILADANGLETARAARDAVMMPVLTACGLKIAKSYFTDVYDYREDDLEEVEDAADASEPGDTTEDAGGMEPVEQAKDPTTVIQPTRGKSITDSKPIGQLD